MSIPRAMSASVRPATCIPPRSGSVTPCTARSASWIASRCASVRADEQRAVDVEEQQHASAQRASERANDVSALSDCANAAMSRAHASMSSSWTISTDECM